MPFFRISLKVSFPEQVPYPAVRANLLYSQYTGELIVVETVLRAVGQLIPARNPKVEF